MSKLSIQEVEQYMKIPLKAARREYPNIVPVIGAGLSMPLGVASWNKLVQELSNAAGNNKSLDATSSELLRSAKEKIAVSSYQTIVRRLLTTSPHKTSLAHQAIVNAKLPLLITTNLDFAIERSFSMAGQPLAPERVIVGPMDEGSYNGASLTDSSTTLIKIHGSLENPETWVLDSSEYDKAYVNPGLTEKWWVQIPYKPLFVGMSLSDEDMAHSLRIAEVSKNKGAYAILHIENIRKMTSTLKRLGITPIAFKEYGQIPEIIDEIFHCNAINIQIITKYKTKKTLLEIGGAKVDIPNCDDRGLLEETISALSNALEFQPLRSLITDENRREYGQKKHYISEVANWINSKLKDRAKCFIQGLLQYPDIFFDEFILQALKNTKSPDNFLKIIWDSANEEDRERISQYILEKVECPYNIRYKELRAIVWFSSAVLKKHPAMRIPPETIKINSTLSITKYPLTRFQVGILLNDNSLKESHPIRPYTLSSQNEALTLLEKLNENTDEYDSWQLPTKEQWKLALNCTSGRWPWGDADPEPKIHAHLHYLDYNGALAPHPLDVGVFPSDVINSKVIDLIGNVYEIVQQEDGFYLAGGSWTTYFRDSESSTFNTVTALGKEGRNNVGVRPVYQN